MTESETHIEQMQVRLKEIAAREQALIDALNEALGQADRKLLDDVRSVTIEHEARRAIIMTELQTLADRIGAFPVSSMPIETIEYEEKPSAIPAVETHISDEPQKGGDWRKATKKIADELDFRLNGSAPQRSVSPAPKVAAQAVR